MYTIYAHNSGSSQAYSPPKSYLCTFFLSQCLFFSPTQKNISDSHSQKDKASSESVRDTPSRNNERTDIQESTSPPRSRSRSPSRVRSEFGSQYVGDRSGRSGHANRGVSGGSASRSGGYNDKCKSNSEEGKRHVKQPSSGRQTKLPQQSYHGQRRHCSPHAH